MATFQGREHVPRRRYVPPSQSPPVRIPRAPAVPSRLGTPGAGRASPSAMSASSNAMDVDAPTTLPRGPLLYAKSDALAAALGATLPIEVQQVLRNADFYREPYTGDVDILTGFALVATVETCFVWQHTQALASAPTCYIFPCPPTNSALSAAPLHALVPAIGGREPGLLLVATDGEIRHWDSVASGLAGAEHFARAALPLEPGETATLFVRADAQTFVIGTTAGRLLRLVLTASGGKSHPSAHAFAGVATGGLSRFLPLPGLWGGRAEVRSSAGGEPQYASALALGAPSPAGRDAWALLERRLQRWWVHAEGWEELRMNEDVEERITERLREAFPGAPKDDAALDLELLDVAVTSPNHLVVLLSYAGVDEDVGINEIPHPRRIYAIARLTYTDDDVAVERVGGVPYHSTSSSGAPMHPRLKVLGGGKAVAVQFGDAVAFCGTESEYQDRLELKSGRDRTLGVGVADGDADGALFLLTASALLRVSLDVEKVVKFDPETGRAQLLKSIMTQAILYGSIPENPLCFTFPPDVDEESLVTGAEQLSEAVLSSDGDLVRRDLELGPQMKIRKELLAFLMAFINENGALTKMSQRSRQRLLADAEKLYAGDQLWRAYGDRHGAPAPVLGRAIKTYVARTGAGGGADVIRAFFRRHIGDLGALLPYVEQCSRQEEADSSALAEANDIVLSVLNAALEYRALNMGVYGVTTPLLKPWTSRPGMIEIVLELFHRSAAAVEAPRELAADARGGKAAPLAQLPVLASALYAAIHERLDWLGSPLVAENQKAARDRYDLEERFRQLRPEVLEILRRNGHLDYAFELAERYRDFQNLAALCNKDGAYPPSENPHADRVQKYFDHYGDAFASELFNWYIEHGEVRALFADEDARRPYLDRFFETRPELSVAWLHELGAQRYGAAAVALLDQANGADELVEKHLMLSIGKLAQLAQAQEERDTHLANLFHDELDFVSVQETLADEFAATASKVRAKPTLDAKVDTVVRAKAANLVDRKAMLQMFRTLVRAILQGKTLGVEDVVDVLTLKDNASEADLECFLVALQLLQHAKDVPDARKAAGVMSVWRRVYMHDDWPAVRQTAGATDAELADRMRSTALFAVLRAAARRPALTALLPDAVLVVPDAETLASRWPGLAPEQLDALLDDYNSEVQVVTDHALQDVFGRISELATIEAYDDA